MLPSDNGDNRKIPPTLPKGLRRMDGMTRLTPSTFLRNFQDNQPESSNFASAHRPRPLSRVKTVIGPICVEHNVDNVDMKMINPQAPCETTPPNGLRRSASGSMLLRQTPERIKRQEQEDSFLGDSPKKRIRRSGSLPRIDPQKLSEASSEGTPKLKRKRTSSLTLAQSPSTLRLRPRASSEVRKDAPEPIEVPGALQPPEFREISPTKKRHRQDSGSRMTSPLKKRHLSAVRILGGQDDDTPSVSTPLRRFKSSINTKLLSERISSAYEQLAESRFPPIVTRTTSGDSYYSASEGGLVEEKEQLEEKEVEDVKNDSEVFLTPQTSFQIEGEMVPLVKKQISIDEKTSSSLQMEDDEDEGFGDSTKTIKKGQGAALARSLSLKLSPRLDQQKPIGADTEKSCSTPSLPTAPLERRASTSSLRFKVSPSTFLRPSPPLPAPLAPPPAEPSVPSTSSTSSTSSMMSTNSEEAVKLTPTTVTTAETPKSEAKKSSLKKEKKDFVVREEHFGPGPPRRRRSIKYEGVKVFYFDRRQGESTVPSEGEVSLDMDNTHHTHRYFPLNTGKRPILDLQLYDDEELSDGEVIHSDEERDYEEFSSAKFIASMNQKFRIKLLKKSGVKVEKAAQSIDTLRKLRVECGCSCENGVCVPETCQCAIDGIQCQVDGGDVPMPCACFAETCTNPNGRIFYDPDMVRHHRTQTIMNWNAAQKSRVGGSPMRKKFVDSDDEEEESKKTWLLQKAIPILKKLESSPTKYPVTPVYTRRSRSSLSDIRESNSELAGITPSTSLSERLKAMQHLENEVCQEADEEKDETLRPQDEEEEKEEEEEADLTLQEVFATTPSEELLEAPALSPVTLVV